MFTVCQKFHCLFVNLKLFTIYFFFYFNDKSSYPINKIPKQILKKCLKQLRKQKKTPHGYCALIMFYSLYSTNLSSFFIFLHIVKFRPDDVHDSFYMLSMYINQIMCLTHHFLQVFLLLKMYFDFNRHYTF